MDKRAPRPAHKPNTIHWIEFAVMIAIIIAFATVLQMAPNVP